MKHPLVHSLFAFLLAIPSSTFATESEFVEDRSVVQLDSLGNPIQDTIITDTYIQDEFIFEGKDETSDKGVINPTKSPAERRFNFGMHSKLTVAFVAGLKQSSDVENKLASKSGSWLGTKDGLGFAFGYYINNRFAFITGFDINVTYFNSIEDISQNSVIAKVTDTKNEYNYTDIESKLKDIYYTDRKERYFYYLEFTLPISLRFHFSEKIWMQLGAEFDFIRYGDKIYDFKVTSDNYIPSDLSTDLSNTNVLVNRKVVPNILFAVGMYWPLLGWIIEPSISASYAFKRIDFDYGLSGKVWTVGCDLYIWFGTSIGK